MEIYLDVLVILNTYLSWILLSLTAMIAKKTLKPSRCAWASFAGGLSSLIILIPSTVKLLSFTSFVLKMLSCPLIIWLAFRGSGLKKLSCLSLIFFAMSLFIGGAMNLLCRILKMPQIALSCGFIYIDITPLTLIISTAVIYVIVSVCSKIFEKNLNINSRYRLDFKIGCKAFSLDASADTGNTARDLFSGLPVVICTGIDIEGGRHLRVVPYKTISGEGILYAYRPDEITITPEGREPEEISALVASADPKGTKHAVFNPTVLYK